MRNCEATRPSGYGNLTIEELTGLGPAIVKLHDGTRNHFVVFRGRFAAAHVLLADPAAGDASRSSAAEFARIWDMGEAFVVRRPGENPTPGHLATTAADFDAVARSGRRTSKPPPAATHVRRELSGRFRRLGRTVLRHREQHDLRPVGGVKLLHDVANVHLHGADRNIELVRDDLVWLALPKPRHDLELSAS